MITVNNRQTIVEYDMLACVQTLLLPGSGKGYPGLCSNVSVEEQNRETQKARSCMCALVCNVQNKRLHCFVTSLLALRVMKQTSRIFELKRTHYRCGSTKDKKPSAVEANAFEWQLMLKFQLLSLMTGQVLFRFGRTTAFLQSSKNW